MNVASFHREAARLRAQLERVHASLTALSTQKPRVLEAIAWPREAEERFFAQGADRLPEVSYAPDRDALEERIRALRSIDASIDGDDPVAAWLRSSVCSLIDANRLVLAAGTREFYRLSRELYGGARTRFRAEGERNLDLAEHLLRRLRIHGWDEARDPGPEPLSAEALATLLRRRTKKNLPGLPLDVVVDGSCTAKVVAGMSRVRVRRGATFQRWEAQGLWHHEVETHALTARNGAEQGVVLLQSGGPRTTATQEGLAVFAEMYNRTLSVQRMERLAMRVRLVAMAEDGASFLDLYRYLVQGGSAPGDAWLDAQRVCRGGRVEGGAPFTKDACYLAGLLRVQAFLAVVVRGGFRDETEMLVAGRIDLDDVLALVLLRGLGILRRPRYVPGWLRAWETLLPSFAFASFMGDVDLAPVERHYRELIEVAEAATEPER